MMSAGNLRLEEVPRIGQGIWRDVADSAEAVRVVCPLCGAAESVAQMAMHLMSHRTAVHASMPLKEREALAKLVIAMRGPSFGVLAQRGRSSLGPLLIRRLVDARAARHLGARVVGEQVGRGDLVVGDGRRLHQLAQA